MMMMMILGRKKWRELFTFALNSLSQMFVLFETMMMILTVEDLSNVGTKFEYTQKEGNTKKPYIK
jgi:hypothetical protein